MARFETETLSTRENLERLMDLSGGAFSGKIVAAVPAAG
jgi:hypothetical protein